jgi:mannose-6-phosphate isomerase-like protein (cupin superfamily)
MRFTRVALAVMTTALVLPTFAQAQAKPAAKMTPKLKWGPAPAVFRQGAKLAVVSGDPMAAGNYVVQLSMPSNYKIAPHFHPTDEHLKVVKGSFKVGMGDKMDAKMMKTLKVGDTATAPATVHHYAETKGATIVEVSGMGPFQLTYVNPADMPKQPEKKAAKTK